VYMCVRGSQDSERSCICVLRMSMLLRGKARIVSDRVMSVKGVHFPVSMIFLLY
jgi:hypothetical protein